MRSPVFPSEKCGASCKICLRLLLLLLPMWMNGRMSCKLLQSLKLFEILDHVQHGGQVWTAARIQAGRRIAVLSTMWTVVVSYFLAWPADRCCRAKSRSGVGFIDQPASSMMQSSVYGSGYDEAIQHSETRQIRCTCLRWCLVISLQVKPIKSIQVVQVGDTAFIPYITVKQADCVNTTYRNEARQPDSRRSILSFRL